MHLTRNSLSLQYSIGKAYQSADSRKVIATASFTSYSGGKGQHITFADLLQLWHQYLAFILSFINVAAFWRAHHDFFIYIKKMDGRLMFFNTCWLFCIVILPFSTSVLSTHFGDSPAMCLYSANILCASIFQNFIWDYADIRAVL